MMDTPNYIDELKRIFNSVGGSKLVYPPRGMGKKSGFIDIIEKHRRKIARMEIPNKDNTMNTQYKVTTTMLNGFDCGDIIELVKYNDDQYALPGAKPGGHAVSKKVIERNPDWFEEVTPEFDVGDWVYYVGSRASLKNGCLIDRVISVDYKGWIGFDGDYLTGSGKRINHWKPDVFRKATSEEIEEHLIKEAKRRGLVEGTLVKNGGLHSSTPPDSNKISFSRYSKYNSSSDRLWVGETGTVPGFSVCIYSNGKWAEIIEDKTPDVTINGHDAEFCDEYVKFGCAKIDKKFVWKLNELLQSEADIVLNESTPNRLRNLGPIVKKIAKYYQQ